MLTEEARGVRRTGRCVGIRDALCIVLSLTDDPRRELAMHDSQYLRCDTPRRQREVPAFLNPVFSVARILTT